MRQTLYTGKQDKSERRPEFTPRALLSLFCAMSVMSCSASLFAEVEPSLRKEKQLEGIEIEDRLGATVDPTLRFTRHDGKNIELREYVGTTNKSSLPVIVTIGYYECPMLCSLVLNALVDTLKKSSLELGKDYRVLSFSVDPKETVQMAALKRDNYLKALGVETGGWDFFTSPEGDIAKLAESLGFGYKYDSYSDEYAHGAGIFILTPDGVLSRTLFGISFDPFNLKLAVVEASKGAVGTIVDRIILSCFHYVPDSDKYGIYVFGAMRLGAALTVLILGSMLTLYWLRERRRQIRAV